MSNREKDEASVKLLERLKSRLLSDGASSRRRAGFHLSWMQEDGMEVLKEVLFGNFPQTAKNAAAYGLRSMRGRMKKMALEILEEGLRTQDRSTREACRHCLSVIEGKTDREPASGKSRRVRRFQIRETRRKSRPGRKVGRRTVRDVVPAR
jgi:hypothetical protein